MQCSYTIIRMKPNQYILETIIISSIYYADYGLLVSLITINQNITKHSPITVPPLSLQHIFAIFTVAPLHSLH